MSGRDAFFSSRNSALKRVLAHSQTYTTAGALAGLLISTNLVGQGTTATLGGTVTDPSGAIISHADIVLKNEATGDQRAAVSNDSGVFTFSAVPTGTYDVSIKANGFRPYEQTGIHLDPGDQRSVEGIHLETGSVSESVEVKSAADTYNIESGEQSSLISAEQIQHLSVEGRDVTELQKILPGFAISRGGAGSFDNSTFDPSQVNAQGALGAYAANGTPVNGQALLSDGVDITDPGAFGGALQNVNYEQVAEVKVQTSSFTADTAHGPIVLNAIGKSAASTSTVRFTPLPAPFSSTRTTGSRTTPARAGRRTAMCTPASRSADPS